MAGKDLAHQLKSLNDRMRPLYDANKIPTVSPKRLRIGAECLTREGRRQEDVRVLSEADFAGWNAGDFDNYNSPPTWTLGAKSKFPPSHRNLADQRHQHVPDVLRPLRRGVSGWSDMVYRAPMTDES